MPDNIFVSVDRPESITVGKLCPGGLGTIRQTVDGHGTLEAVVRFHAVEPLGDFAPVMVATIADHVRPGQLTAIIGSGVGQGPFQEIPVTEVLIDGGTTLSEHLVRAGIARPDPDLLDAHIRRDHLRKALEQARLAGRGYWGEYHAETRAEAILGPDLAAATVPPAAAPDWFVRTGMLLLLLLFLGLATLGRSTGNQRRGPLAWIQSNLLGVPRTIQGGIARTRGEAPRSREGEDDDAQA